MNLAQFGLVLLPLAVGMVAVWLLLPSDRGRQVVFSAAIAAGAAFIVGGLVLLQRTGPDVPLAFHLLFCTFAAMAIGSGVCMITQSNPVYCALWFALVVLSTCGLFLLQSAMFLAAATIIVYAGAIVVTFLFVIMLAQQTGLAAYDRHAREPLLACIAAFVLLAVFQYALALAGRPATPNAAEPRDLPRALRLLADAQKQLAQGQSPDDVGKELLLRSENPDSTVANVLFQLTETLPADERAQARTALESATTKLGRARLVEDRKLMDESLAELDRIGQSLLLRLQGSPYSQMQVDHVAGLGQSLFGDYLWAVEVAGTLLLIATVGAIAIALRRKEGNA